MSRKDIGLYRKYNVSRTDGKRVNWCFVLEDKDPVAPKALRYLANLYMARGFDDLADDLLKTASMIEGGIRPSEPPSLEELTRVSDVEGLVPERSEGPTEGSPERSDGEAGTPQ